MLTFGLSCDLSIHVHPRRMLSCFPLVCHRFFFALCVCDFSREVQECVPPQFYCKQGSQLWLNMTTQHMQQVQPLNPHQARAQFLGETPDLIFHMTTL